MKKGKKEFKGGLTYRGSILTSRSAALGLILNIPKNFSLDVASIY